MSWSLIQTFVIIIGVITLLVMAANIIINGIVDSMLHSDTDEKAKNYKLPFKKVAYILSFCLACCIYLISSYLDYHQE